MSIVQVIIDQTSSIVITGTRIFDRANGGIFVGGSGTSFPATPIAGEWFWRTDEAKLYRRNDANSAWVAVTTAVASHATTHQPGGTDAMAVDAAAGTGSLRTLGTSATSACAGNDARLSDTRLPRDFQQAASEGVSTISGTTAWQDKVTITTPVLTGTYLVRLYIELAQSVSNKLHAVRLYNSTDATELCNHESAPGTTSTYQHVNGDSLVTFTGAAKTFIGQFAATSTPAGGTVSCRRAGLMLWRVS